MSFKILAVLALTATMSFAATDLKTCYGDDEAAIIPLKLEGEDFVIALLLRKDGVGTFVRIPRTVWDKTDFRSRGLIEFPQDFCARVRAEALEKFR